jgi:hypothetical protein
MQGTWLISWQSVVIVLNGGVVIPVYVELVSQLP